MLRRSIVLLALLDALSLVAYGQELTAREYATAHGWKGGDSRQITLGLPHACTLSKQHPCIYYGGDIDPNDPEENGLSNENTTFIADSWTYTEVRVPVQLRIAAAFTNNLQTFGIIDPQTANWDFRTGVHEYYGGTSIGSGTSPAELTATGRSAFGFEEYELLTRTPVLLPKGNVWFDVEPNCTNPNDPLCNIEEHVCAAFLMGNSRCENPASRYFESDTDGLNGINSKFTVTSKTGMGPTFYNPLYEGNWDSWCNDEGAACGDGTSAGLLK